MLGYSHKYWAYKNRYKQPTVGLNFIEEALQTVERNTGILDPLGRGNSLQAVH